MRGFPFNGVEPYEQPPPSDDTDGRDPFVGFGHGCDFAQVRKLTLVLAALNNQVVLWSEALRPTEVLRII